MFDFLFGEKLVRTTTTRKIITEGSKKMYSEEDLREAFIAGLRKAHSFKKHSQCWEEWIEQYKNKK